MTTRSAEDKELIVREYRACENQEARQDVLDRWHTNQSCVSRWARGQGTKVPGRPRGQNKKHPAKVSPALEELIRSIVRDELQKQAEPVVQPTQPMSPDGPQIIA